jgi:hypothetical protein
MFPILMWLLGYVPAGLPELKLPPFGFTRGNETDGETVTFTEMVGHLGSSIIVLPILALLENIAICKAFCKSNTSLEHFVKNANFSPRYGNNKILCSSGSKLPVHCNKNSLFYMALSCTTTRKQHVVIKISLHFFVENCVILISVYFK